MRRFWRNVSNAISDIDWEGIILTTLMVICFLIALALVTILVLELTGVIDIFDGSTGTGINPAILPIIFHI